MESARIPSVDEIFRRFVGNGFSEFAGLMVEASIPVTEQVFNEIIETALRDNKNITACRVSIGPENQISVDLRTPLWFLPIHLKLRVEKSVDCTSSPKVRARLENLGFLGKLGSFLKALPNGVNMNGDLVVVDMGAFIPQEYKQFLDLVKSIAIRTEAGRVILDLKLEVEKR